MRAPEGDSIAAINRSLQLLADSQAAIARHEQLMDTLSRGALSTTSQRSPNE
jgi:hypothetical protein